MGRLTEKQNAILIGSVLGDGYIRVVNKQSGSFEIRQHKSHHDYIIWMKKELKDIVSMNPYQRKDNQQWRLWTRFMPEILDLHRIFYFQRKKFIPANIEEILKHPISLAVWYMEDGTLDWRPHNHYAFRIATNCFSLEDHGVLVEVLKNNFGIEATAQKSTMRGKLYYRLHIGARGRDRFLNLIRPHIAPSFQYKLPPVVI